MNNYKDLNSWARPPGKRWDRKGRESGNGKTGAWWDAIKSGRRLSPALSQGESLEQKRVESLEAPSVGNCCGLIFLWLNLSELPSLRLWL